MLKAYKLVIFDMDGTMYYQPALRRQMMVCLFRYYLCHPWKWRELWGLEVYRQIRERFSSQASAALEDELRKLTAEKTGIAPEIITNSIHRWLEVEPLNYLFRYRDQQAAELMKGFQSQGIRAVIYSDYPAEEKIKALKLNPLQAFFGGQEEINCLKPNPAGLKFILKHFQIKPNEALMIGDRMVKDGLAAQGAGIDYLILKRYKYQRRKQYRSLL